MLLPKPLHFCMMRACGSGVPMTKRATAAAFLVAMLAASGATAAPIEELDGYWSGSGTVVLSGSTERVKCAVRYRVGQDGTQIKQTMRCASPDHAINATANLAINGTQVEGNWEEKTYSASG